MNLKPRVQEAFYRVLMHEEDHPVVWTTAGGRYAEHTLSVEFHDTQDAYLAKKSVGASVDVEEEDLKGVGQISKGEIQWVDGMVPKPIIE